MSCQLSVTSCQKIIWILALLAGGWRLAAGGVSAQSELADYQFQYEQYRNIYPQFTSARDKYLQFQTLASKEEAILNTKQILIQRAQVMRAHLLLLKNRLSQAPEIVSEARTRLSTSLDTEIEWLDGHMKELNLLSSPTLGELFEISDRFERREKDYRLLSYETLSRILVGNIRQMQTDTVGISVQLDDYLLQRKGSDSSKLLENWLDEAKNSIYWSQKGIEKAEEAIVEMTRYKGDSKETVRQFSKIQLELEGSKQWLIKVTGFQKEIIDQVRKD